MFLGTTKSMCGRRSAPPRSAIASVSPSVTAGWYSPRRAALHARAIDLAVLEEHDDGVAVREVLLARLARPGRGRVLVARASPIAIRLSMRFSPTHTSTAPPVSRLASPGVRPWSPA